MAFKAKAEAEAKEADSKESAGPVANVDTHREIAPQEKALEKKARKAVKERAAEKVGLQVGMMDTRERGAAKVTQAAATAASGRRANVYLD